MTKDKENKIRERVSYKQWDNLYNAIKKRTSIGDILWKVHGMIDTKRGYKSRQASIWAQESMCLLLKDKRRRWTRRY